VCMFDLESRITTVQVILIAKISIRQKPNFKVQFKANIRISSLCFTTESLNIAPFQSSVTSGECWQHFITI
jgi:hypothetical protein